MLDNIEIEYTFFTRISNSLLAFTDKLFLTDTWTDFLLWELMWTFFVYQFCILNADVILCACEDMSL